MRSITIIALLFSLVGCATLRRSNVGPQVLTAYPSASDASIPEMKAPSAIKRRLWKIIERNIRVSTRSRRVHGDMDRRATIIDILATFLPGGSPQIR
jgi:hypothetical protein